MILVTGATGFIGRHLVTALAGEGEPVRAMARHPGAVDFPDGVDRVEADVCDAASLGPALAGCRLVYHAAGHYRGTNRDIWRVHAQGTANLLSATDPGSRVVLVSSTSVYGWERPWPADEQTPPRPETAYGSAKLAAEQLVLGWQRGDGIVARSTIVYGPGDSHGMLARATRLLGAGWRWFPGDGRNRVHLLHVDDLVRGLLALGHEGSGVYLFAGPEAVPVAEVLGGLSAAQGLRPPAFGVPASLVSAGASAVEALWPRRPAPLSVHSVDVATRDRSYLPRRAEAELGWRPQVDLATGLAGMGQQGIGGSTMQAATCPGSPWEPYFEDHDEGVGSVYERFVLDKVIDKALTATGSRNILHAPMFGMCGVPGLDAIFQARRGVPVGLVDVSPDRLDAVVRLWKELGCEPTATYVAPWPDTSAWADVVPAASYDLVLSFAALWWCESPWEVLAAQARWASRGVLLCIPNRNVFMQVRSRLWHEDMFEHLNPVTLDRATVEREAGAVGLTLVDTGLFDIPPFPDTAISIKELIPALGRRASAKRADGGEDAWRWEVVSYLKGEDPTLADRIARLGFLEQRVGGSAARRLAHHRYYLFVPASATQSR